ncbi:hypothetical protein ACHAPJ_009780 [Fusarium lateritium]
MSANQVGFAGLGAMGFGMASNLVKAGFSVHGFDISPISLKKFTKLGGSASSSLREASDGQNKFFVMVATPEQVDAIVFGPNGLASTLPRLATLCLFSTLPPQYVKSLLIRLEHIGRGDIRLVDCPVSGGVVGANAGKLTVMLGGDNDTIDEIQPELEAISAPGRLFRVGPIGAASKVKMLNQHLAGTHIIAAAETLAFAKALGVSSREAYKILMDSDGASWIMGDRGLSMLNADWTPKSAVSIFTKDLSIVNDAADRLSLPVPIASAAFQSFAERDARGHGRDDDASVVCNYEELIGTTVAAPENAPMLSPGESPTEYPCILLVAKDKAWADNLRRKVSLSIRSEASELEVSIVEAEGLLDALSSLPQNALVGVTGFETKDWKHYASEHPRLHFFDYQIDASGDENCYKVLFTAQNRSIPATLELALGPQFRLTPVSGSLGAATAMHLTIRRASLIHVAAAAECFALAIAEGVSAQLVYELIAGAAGSSVQFAQVMPRMIQQDFELDPKLGVRTLSEELQDLAEIKAESHRINFPGRLLDAVHQIFKKVNRELDGQHVSTAALTRFWISDGTNSGLKVVDHRGSRI